jgi:hypothetical protein
LSGLREVKYGQHILAKGFVWRLPQNFILVIKYLILHGIAALGFNFSARS